MIKGPRDQAAYQKLFETHQPLNAENTAKDYGFDYLSCKNLKTLKQHLENFYSIGNLPKILEIYADTKHNAEVMHAFRKAVII